MADEDSVGKIGLDIEITGDIDKQIEQFANKISEGIGKKLENSIKNLNFENISNGISEALNGALNSINETIKSNVEKNKATILKSIEEIKEKALDAIRSIVANAKKIKIPLNFSPVQNIATPSQTYQKVLKPRGPPKSSSINLESLKAKIDNLSNSLEITNRRIEQQQEKLAGLKESYNSTFNQARKNKIQEQILKTEAVINKLIAKSDATGFKLADLDREFERLGNASKNSTIGLNEASNSMKRLENATSRVSRRLRNTNNSTRQYRENINGARSATGMFIDSMFKWGIVFPIIMKGISAVGGYIGSALMTNAQFANSLIQIRTNLIVAFMPIYEYILPALNALMSALANVTAYIAAFINAIFGKTYQASFGAAQSMNASIAAMKNMEKQSKKTSNAVNGIGKAAKKSKGTLAGFDEINKLKGPKEPKEKSGGIKPIPLLAPNVDLSPTSAAMQTINGMVDKLKDTLSRIFQPFKNAWASEGAATIESIKHALYGIKELLGAIGHSFMEVWTNGTGEAILTTILQILQNIFNLIGDIGITFADAWNAGGIGTAIVQALANAFLNVLTLIKHMGDSLREVWGEVGPGIAATFMQVLNATAGVLENLTQKLVYVWDNGGSHLFQGFVRLGAKIFELAGYIYTNFVAPMINWFVNLISPVVAKLADIVGSVLDAFSNLIGWLLGNGKPVLDIMIVTVTAFFTAWKVAKLMAFMQQAGGVIGVINTMGTALKACTLTKIADKLETAKLTLMYAKDFAVSIAKGTAEISKQIAQFVISKGAKLADVVATKAVALATNTMTIAQKALNLAMSMNPITLVVGLLLGLAAVFVTLYNKCDWFRNGVNNVWASIKSVFTKFDNFLTGLFTTDWTKSFGVFGNIINAFMRNVENKWNAIKRIFGGIIDFITGIFTGNWSRAWQGVVNIFGGIMNGLGAVIKAPLNTVIGLVNAAISGLNKISFTAPDWLPGGLGGKHFGVNLPKIPYLAKGGIVDKPTQAVVGEAGTEAVVPLENNTGGLNLLANILSERISKMVSIPNIIKQPNLTMLGQNVSNDSKMDYDYIEKLKEAIIEALKEGINKNGDNNNNNNYNGDLNLELIVGDDKICDLIIKAFRRLERKTGKQILNI
ncbi:TPA: hypothetical protein ACG0NJ_001127 [Clostridium perfringens]|uniref:hypothetical protein n=1 Tax=Clostridium perfringens TaxID=1502 RepID=UPI0010DEEABE|nr:hypothetical protein [Clostridium perfringens]VTQ60186.1 TMP repeat family [Clostridium perfringens]